jgi:hypothetical protein
LKILDLEIVEEQYCKSLGLGFRTQLREIMMLNQFIPYKK